MRRYPLPEGTIYRREKVAEIWMIVPCNLQYEKDTNKVAILSVNGKMEHTLDEFRNLCKKGIYARNAETAYQYAMKEINGDR